LPADSTRSGTNRKKAQISGVSTVPESRGRKGKEQAGERKERLAEIVFSRKNALERTRRRERQTAIRHLVCGKRIGRERGEENESYEEYQNSA